MIKRQPIGVQIRSDNDLPKPLMLRRLSRNSSSANRTLVDGIDIYRLPGVATGTYYGKAGNRLAEAPVRAAICTCSAELRSVAEGASPNSFR